MRILHSSFRTVGLSLVLALSCAGQAPNPETMTVGLQADGRIVVPTNQILKPAGQQITFPGRPVDLAWADEDTLNRIPWHATRGDQAPYPKEFAGKKEDGQFD